jgi:hypothetical protein
MKFRTLTLKQAEEKHPGCYLETKMRTTSDGIPEHEALPVSAMPAIFVWPARQMAADGDESGCVVIYWLDER